MQNSQFESLLAAAHQAARDAQAGMKEGTGLDCGFAWVVISGNEPLARYCRSRITQHGAHRSVYGSKGEPGWQWWKPGAYAGQSIGIHEAGAKAFRDVLAVYGIRADVCSRYD